MKRILALVMVLAMMLSLCACGAAEKVFTCKELSITLNSSFSESSVEGQDAYYQSNKVGVTVLKDPKANLTNGATMTNKEYAELVVELYNKNTIGGIQEADGLTYFTYTAVIDSESYTYQSYVFNNTDAFWMVQFFCFTDDYGKYTDDFNTWAKSVVFSGSSASEDNTTPVETTEPQPVDNSKTFTCGKVTLTLDNTFEETEVDGQDSAYLSDSVGVTVLSQTRDEMNKLGYEGDTMTAADYAELIIEGNELNSQGVTEENGLTTYVYNASSTNYNFTYQAYVLEDSEGFYMVQFYCVDSNYSAKAPQFSQWASQIVLGE